MKIPYPVMLGAGALAILCVAQLSAMARNASVGARPVDNPLVVPTASGACPGTANLPLAPDTGRPTVQPLGQPITIGSGAPQQQ